MSVRRVFLTFASVCAGRWVCLLRPSGGPRQQCCMSLSLSLLLIAKASCSASWKFRSFGAESSASLQKFLQSAVDPRPPLERAYGRHVSLSLDYSSRIKFVLDGPSREVADEHLPFQTHWLFCCRSPKLGRLYVEPVRATVMTMSASLEGGEAVVRAVSLAEAEKGKCRCSLNIRMKEMLSELMEGPKCSLTALEASRVSFVKERETKQVLFPLQMLLSTWVQTVWDLVPAKRRK